ncbi:2-hydroxyacid dehydrogenase family protein [Pediococcus argentinicus]|uniref:2-hydroxyacid dehydrogenase family protein n=1 Tax=Pediococcus argentinicus TaxID=480391 RepID=UPI00338F82B8
MAKVYLSAELPTKATDILKEAGLDVESYSGNGLISHDELKENVRDADYLITALSTNVDKDIIQSAPNLKLIANYGAGFNNIDVEFAKQQGIPVTNTPGVSTTSTAEVTVGLILSIMHRMPEGDRLMRSKGFDGWAPLFFLGHVLENKTVGIIGMGSIGQAVAKRLLAFNMKVIYSQRHPLPAYNVLADKVKYVPQDELIKTADVVTLHVPLGPATKHLIDANALANMKSSSYLVNAARGPIIDEQAVLKALQKHEIAGAALDVYEAEPQVADEFKKLDNVVLTPHIGNATVEARDGMAEIVAENVRLVNSGEAAKFIVNK